MEAILTMSDNVSVKEVKLLLRLLFQCQYSKYNCPKKHPLDLYSPNQTNK